MSDRRERGDVQLVGHTNCGLSSLCCQYNCPASPVSTTVQPLLSVQQETKSNKETARGELCHMSWNRTTKTEERKGKSGLLIFHHWLIASLRMLLVPFLITTLIWIDVHFLSNFLLLSDLHSFSQIKLIRAESRQSQELAIFPLHKSYLVIPGLIPVTTTAWRWPVFKYLFLIWEPNSLSLPSFFQDETLSKLLDMTALYSVRSRLAESRWCLLEA